MHEHADHVPNGAVPAGLAGEQITLTSAGIDIGSATSHLLVSELELRRRGVALSSGYAVVRREIQYRSRVILTPYSNPDTIDAQALQRFIEQSYEHAGVSAETIDTGAVIVTGEAARKHNAEAIARIFSEHSGKFVCAVAGPLLEARLAVHGSGAVRLSADNPDRPVLNLDIGGGTSKISLLRAGHVERVVVLNVGARLVAWDQNGVVVRTEQAGLLAAQQCGADVEIGSTTSVELRERIATWLTDRLFDALTGTESPHTSRLHVAGAAFEPPDGSAIVVSGGVAEYVYETQDGDFGDLGPAIGRAVRARIAASGRDWQLVPAAQRIRSTAIGASQYTVQVSGNTIFVADRTLLPLRNLAVLHVSLPGPQPSAHQVQRLVADALSIADEPDLATPLVLAFHGAMTASYPCLHAFCEGLAAAHRAAGPRALVVVLDQDVAGLVGNLLARELHVRDVICVDQVSVDDLDYIDIGTPIPHANAVPVMAKSLLFG